MCLLSSPRLPQRYSTNLAKYCVSPICMIPCIIGCAGQAPKRIRSPDDQEKGYRGQRRSNAESNGAGEASAGDWSPSSHIPLLETCSATEKIALCRCATSICAANASSGVACTRTRCFCRDRVYMKVATVLWLPYNFGSPFWRLRIVSSGHSTNSRIGRRAHPMDGG